MLSILMKQVAKTEDPAVQANLLRGMSAAMKGRRDVTPPPEWDALSASLSKSENAEVRDLAQSLGAIFGSTSAFAEMRQTAADANADPAVRTKALQALLAGKDAETLPMLKDLVKTPGPLRREAIRGLATFDDPQTPEVLLGIYGALTPDEKRDAISVLLARPATAKAIVAALEQKRLVAGDLVAAQLHQLAAFNDPKIDAWLKANTAMAVSSPDKQAEIARYKTFLTPEFVRTGDPHRGRALFAQTCAICHKLFDAGASIGPELTGSNRNDIDYLLQNVVDPNALIGEAYQSVTAELKDGRIVVGMIRAEDTNTVTFKTLAEELIIPRDDIAKRTVSKVSMMPEGLLSALSKEQIADLFAYAGSPQQVPMQITPVNALDFFNGVDLSRWQQTGDVWRIESGELAGHAATDTETAALTSAMVAGDYTLTGQLKLTGAQPAAEIALRGMDHDRKFAGTSLSFGGPSAVNLWQYDGSAKPVRVAGKRAFPTDQWVPFEVSVKGDQVRVSLAGESAVEATALASESRLNGIAFYLHGKGSELRIKDLKIDPTPAP